MATVKTHDLIHCNPLYDSLPSVNNSGLYTHNGQLVRFDNLDIKSYRVKKNVQGRFNNPSTVNASMPYPDGLRAEIEITSIKFNGQEYLSAPASLTVIPSNQQLTTFPNYTVGNYYSYTDNVANAAIVVPTSTIIPSGLWLYNFYDFLKSTVEGLNINVNVCITHPLWWTADEWIRFNNFTIEKHYDDNFEITYTHSTYNLTDDSLIDSIVKHCVFNGETILETWDGVPVQIAIDSGATPQFSDVNSIFSYDFDYDAIEEIASCPKVDSFSTSLMNNQSCASMTTDANCTKITFADNSNYYNSLPGHEFYNFTSRTITMTRPNGTTYVWATSDIEGADEVIPPHYNSSNTFVYNIGSKDEDGIYEFQLCTYPDWRNDVLYQAYTNTIVRKDGKLYKVLASNTNVDPTAANGASYWTEYSCIGNCETTRYCTKEKIVVLCVSLLRCYKKLVKEAFCGIESAPCKPMCENKKMLSAMKFKITMDSLEFSVCAEDWTIVKDHIDILKSICCCNG